MKEHLKKLPKEIQDLIHLAGDIAAKNSMSCYLVGGFVRDLILTVKNLDLDIVVEGDAIKFAEIFSERSGAGITRHKRFGTATIILKEHLKVDPSTSLEGHGESFDVAQDASKDAERVEARSRTIDFATARSEQYPQPACLPEVTPGTLRDDLMRRDFTINAMAISINQPDFGTFIDLFGGRKDLDHKNIRVLHNLSFIDDPTRILRAIRFEQRYGFNLEPITLKLLKEAVLLKMLEKVQPQRLRDELILLLKEEYPLRMIRRIKELAGFDFISPELSLTKDNFMLLESIQRQINWFKLRYPKRRRLDAWLIYFMGLVDSLNINDIKSIFKRFALCKGDQKRISAYKKLSKKLVLQLCLCKIKPSKIFNLLEPLSYEVIVLIKAKCKNKNLKSYIEDFFDIYNDTRLYITGDDLRRLGLAPGPHYQKLLRRVLNARLNGLIKTKEEELGMIMKWS